MNRVNYSKQLTEMVEHAGVYLQKHAKEIIGTLDLQTDLTIEIAFHDYNGMLHRFPEMTIRRTHLIDEKTE